MNQTYINAVRLSRVLKAAFPNTLPKFGERIEVEGTEYCISQVSAHPRSPLPWDLPPKVAWPIWRQQQAQRQQNRRVPGGVPNPEPRIPMPGQPFDGNIFNNLGLPQLPKTRQLKTLTRSCHEYSQTTPPCRCRFVRPVSHRPGSLRSEYRAVDQQGSDCGSRRKGNQNASDN